MEKRLLHYLESAVDYKPGMSILAAVSGGMDSVVMAHLFHALGLPFSVAHCNFSLRGKESDMDEAFTLRLAQSFQVPFHSKRFDTQEYARSKHVSIQMAARELRYAWFEEVREANGLDLIATAHHLDDQAETFFINLLRGCGIAGLHGIKPRQGRLIRPMLFASKQAINAYALENEIKFREDSSNSELYYLRNRLRHEIFPLLRKIHPSFDKILEENILRLNQEELIFLRKIEEEKSACLTETPGGAVILSIDHLKSLSPLPTYLYYFLVPYGFNIEEANSLAKSINKPATRLVRSASHHLVKERGRLIIYPSAEASVSRHMESGSEYQIYPDLKEWSIDRPFRMDFSIFRKTGDFRIDTAPSVAQLDAGNLQWPLVLRRWKKGDRFMPLGMKGIKKLSDFFTDMKIGQLEKEKCYVLCSGDKIAWLVGYRIDDRFKIRSSTKEVLRITVNP